MRALFFFGWEGRGRKGRGAGDVSKGGVWLRRLVTGPIANSPVPGSDSAIGPVAMLARHPLSTKPPASLPFLSLTLQDGKKQGRRLRMDFYIRQKENDAAPGICQIRHCSTLHPRYRSLAHETLCPDWMSQRGRR